MWKRNLLDIYLVDQEQGESKSRSDDDRAQRGNKEEPRELPPAVVVVGGGAWIIGYKAWSVFLAKVIIF